MSSTTRTPDLGNRYIDRTLKKPAVAQWQKLDGQISVQKGLSLQLRHEVGSNEALFKISAFVNLKNDGDSYRRNRVYLFIPPERIRSLTLDEDPDTRHRLGAGTICLRFSLGSPIMAVVGPIPELAPYDKASRDLLDALRMLAGELNFAVYTNPQAGFLPTMRSLCEAASQGRLESTADHTSFARLYDRDDGVVVNMGALARVLTEAALIDDGQESSSPGPSKKRQRVASGGPRPLGVPGSHQELTEDTLDRRLTAPNRDMTEGRKHDMTQQLEEMEGRKHDMTRQLEEMKGRKHDMTRQLEEMEGRKHDMTRQLEEMEGRKHDITQQLKDDITQQLKDDMTQQLGGMKHDVTRHVESILDELREVAAKPTHGMVRKEIAKALRRGLDEVS